MTKGIHVCFFVLGMLEKRDLGGAIERLCRSRRYNISKCTNTYNNGCIKIWRDFLIKK